jgi:hypothetical protein
VTTLLISAMGGRSRPLINTARDTLQSSANQQYRDFIRDFHPGQAVLKAAKLDRFTKDSWEGSLTRVTVNGGEFTEDHLAQILRKGDFWARDAERGQLINYTQRDSRIDRWARIDPEPPSCPFCTILISRGAVYRSKKSAGVAATAKFHTGCTCTAVLVDAEKKDSFDGVEFRDKALKEYQDAARLAGNTSLKDIIAAMKENRAGNPNTPGSTKKATDRIAKKAADSV